MLYWVQSLTGSLLLMWKIVTKSKKTKNITYKFAKNKKIANRNINTLFGSKDNIYKFC